MKILLITLSYPPLNNAQSIRWKYLVHHFRELGYSVSIIAPDVCSQEEGVIPCNPGVTVSKLLSPDSRRKKNNKLYKWILYLYETMSFGDAYIEWAFRLNQCLKKIHLSDFDVIIFSVEPHISTVLPVLRLDHPSVVLDIGDPPIPGYFSGIGFFEPLYRSILKRIFSKVKGIVYTGYSPKFCLEKKFSILRKKKSIVIHQGFPSNFINSFNRITNNKQLKVFYAGNFIGKIRDPSLLADVLSEFKKEILFIHAGNDKWINMFKNRLQESFIYLGKLSHEEVINWYKSVDVLLYLGNATSCQLSGKFFEYLGFRKPMLHIYQNFRDDTVFLFHAMPVGLSVFYERLSLRLALKRLIDTFKSGYLSFYTVKCPKDLLLKFSWKGLAQEYLSFLEVLT